MKIGMTPERRVQLEIDGGYDKHGDVFVIARPLAGFVSFPVKTFGDAKALEQFIEKFTFFRYVGQCPSWGSVLFANDCFSGEEKYSDTLKGKSYTSEEGKAYVIQLIASGELVVHCTGSWIPPVDRNHHLPWPKSSAKEEFVTVKHQPYTLGPHEEPGYVPPVETSTVLDEKVVPNQNLGGAGGNWQVLDEVADPSVIKQVNDLSCGQACVGMMLGDRKISASQDVIAKLAGDGPTYEAQLASVLNKLDSSNSRQWIGAGVDAEDIETFQGLSSTGSWGAQLWEKGNKIGHWVVVDGLDDAGKVMVRDPWQATKYKMDLTEFQNTWTGYSVWGQ